MDGGAWVDGDRIKQLLYDIIHMQNLKNANLWKENKVVTVSWGVGK